MFHSDRYHIRCQVMADALISGLEDAVVWDDRQRGALLMGRVLKDWDLEFDGLPTRLQGWCGLLCL